MPATTTVERMPGNNRNARKAGRGRRVPDASSTLNDFLLCSDTDTDDHFYIFPCSVPRHGAQLRDRQVWVAQKPRNSSILAKTRAAYARKCHLCGLYLKRWPPRHASPSETGIHGPHDRLGLCNLFMPARRATVSALGAALFEVKSPDLILLLLAVLVLWRDGTGGWLARRQNLASSFGAWFDVNVDVDVGAACTLRCAVYGARVREASPHVILPGLAQPVKPSPPPKKVPSRPPFLHGGKSFGEVLLSAWRSVATNVTQTCRSPSTSPRMSETLTPSREERETTDIYPSNGRNTCFTRT